MGIEKSRPVLITGCSTGIGRATAERLADEGYNVARHRPRAPRRSRISPSEGCKTQALDVTDEGSMESAVAEVEKDGPIGALVNNAGYSQSGAIETIPMDSVRRQFETNVFGLMRMCQLVLPGMRRAGLRPDREPELDGRQAHLPRWRASTTRPSTRSRRSPTRCASRSRVSASTW